MTARILVNGKAVAVTFSRKGEAWEFEIGGRSAEAVVAQPENGVYHVLLNGRSYEVRVSGDRMDIEGHELQVLLDNTRDAPAWGLEGSVQGRQRISAPMPGKVVRVLVAEGEQVQRDQGIVVIEAMKMQNQMKSPKEGRVASLQAVEGRTVAAGDVLAVIE
jgi:biotin carboxyl carrier protein